jgi:hypothetical protein
MSGAEKAGQKLARMREQVAPYGMPLALTEGHYTFSGLNRGNLLSAWAIGVAYARIHNLYKRNGDVLKIATLADFCGTRWLTHAVIMPMPGERHTYMMPVARVMSLFRRHTGRKAVTVTGVPDGLDVTASRTGRRIYLHVVNTRRTAAVTASFRVEGMEVVSGKVFEIAAPPELEVRWQNADALAPVASDLPASGRWRFAPASVTAVELHIEKGNP